MSAGKLQIAVYWCAGCGGCDVAVLDTGKLVVELGAVADIRLWPFAFDGKYADLDAMPDGELDAALVNGAVRNTENLEMARLLRRKAKLLVAFGSCAHLGGIPGLANFGDLAGLLQTVYCEGDSLEPGSANVPAQLTGRGTAQLKLPELLDRVSALDQVVDVDYYLPGCPPAVAQVRSVLGALVAGALPPRGSVVGASERSVCDECHRERHDKKVSRFYRPWEVIQDPKRCLLEQGIVCAGPATRGGCGVRCPNSGMPCRGCYGPLPGVADQGARLLSAVASVIDSEDKEEVDRILDGIPDFAGLAYRFGLPTSILQRRHDR